jgi:hypothetical protein
LTLSNAVEAGKITFDRASPNDAREPNRSEMTTS